MITFLSKLFIKNHEDTKDPAVRQAYGVLCGAVGIALNLLLFAGKFFAGFVSGSIAITADAFNNLSDAGSSVITLIGFKMAGQEPDTNHPFGHGRIEYISGLFVSVIILIMAFELLKSSVEKIFHPKDPAFSPVILIILLLSILVKCYMAFYNRTVSEKIKSASMKATATDSLSDCLATAVVLFSTLLSHFTALQIDGFCGVLVGLFIFYAGIGAARDTISPLLGQAPDSDFVKQVYDIVLSYEGIIGIHDLIVHNYGPGRVLISLHAEVPADSDLLAIHETIDAAEHKLHDILRCSAVIHMDPVAVGDEETSQLKQLVSGYLREIHPDISMHDFRIVKGPTRTNLIFDLAIPYSFPMKDEELVHTVRTHIQTEHPEFSVVIEVDKLLL